MNLKVSIFYLELEKYLKVFFSSNKTLICFFNTFECLFFFHFHFNICWDLWVNYYFQFLIFFFSDSDPIFSDSKLFFQIQNFFFSDLKLFFSDSKHFFRVQIFFFFRFQLFAFSSRKLSGSVLALMLRGGAASIVTGVESWVTGPPPSPCDGITLRSLYVALASHYVSIIATVEDGSLQTPAFTSMQVRTVFE